MVGSPPPPPHTHTFLSAGNPVDSRYAAAAKDDEKISSCAAEVGERRGEERNERVTASDKGERGRRTGDTLSPSDLNLDV